VFRHHEIPVPVRTDLSVSSRVFTGEKSEWDDPKAVAAGHHRQIFMGVAVDGSLPCSRVGVAGECGNEIAQGDQLQTSVPDVFVGNFGIYRLKEVTAKCVLPDNAAGRL